MTTRRRKVAAEPKSTFSQVEWVTRQVKDEEGKSGPRHYLVTLSGEIIGAVDEPRGDHLAYGADLWNGTTTYWINLGTAKAKLELQYLESQDIHKQKKDGEVEGK